MAEYTNSGSETIAEKFVADLRTWARVWNRKVSIALFLRLAFLEPGFQLSTLFRLRELLRRIPAVGPLMDRILRLLGVVIYSADLTPQAVIGGGVYLPHPVGIVVGKAIIGQNVAILQGVTIGVVEGLPTQGVLIGNGVWIYAGAKVLGDIIIGNGAKVGANAVVLKSVPANCSAVGVPARIVHRDGPVNSDSESSV